MVKDRGTESPATGSATLLLIGLIWLGTTMYAARAAITGSADTLSGALAAAVAALPGVVAATLAVGASIAAAVGGRSRSAGRRLGAGLAIGALVGLAVAAGIRFAYSDETVLMAVAVAAGIAGGALAVLPGDVLKAGLWGVTGVFVTGVVFGFLQPHLVKLLGGGEAAESRFVLGQSLVTALVAAICSVGPLRVNGRRVLWQLAGGALPGLVLLGVEGLTRAGGSAAARLAHSFPADSQALVGLSDSARLRHGLIVLAVGGLTALLVGALKNLLSRRQRTQTHTPTRASLDAFHETLARIGLTAGEPYGFVLAGGHAMRAAGFLNRPTEDVDLFTVWERRSDFGSGVRAIVDAYVAAGLSVQSERRHDSFIRLTISHGAQTANVDLGVDVRANDPVRIPVGPVLHPDDVVGNKMRALYERAHACDFVDIDAVLRSGRYDLPTLLQLARRSDITFDGRVFAEALGKVPALADDDFAQYGLAGEELEGLRQRFAQRREDLLDAAGPPR